MPARAEPLAFPSEPTDPEIPQEIPVYAQAWDDAIRTLEGELISDDYARKQEFHEQTILSIFARRCLTNAADHLSKRLARTFRDKPRFDSEQVALGILKGAADDLRTASRSLLEDAERLKSLGKGTWANQSYLAGKRAQQAAEGLVGSA